MSLSYETQPGDIDHLIADDHAVVARLFEHLEAGRGDRRTLADQVGFNLALHADAEERTLYPQMAHAGEEQESRHARDEHHAAKQQLVILDRTEPGSGEFEQALSTLMADIRQHVAEEEGQFLPGFREAVGADEMSRLGGEFLAAKRAAPTRAHPRAPSSGGGHALADPAAAVLDKARDKSSGRDRRLATDASGLLDPQAQRLMDAFGALSPLPPEILTPEQARQQPTLVDAVRQVLAADGRPTDPEQVGGVDDVPVAVADGHTVMLRVYRPRQRAAQPPPVIMWIHGGGWVLYDIDTYDASCRGLCNRTGAIVVSPQYRRAPEHPFPASHDDVLATWRWTSQHAAEFGADPRRLAIGGESVGATMAAATCLQLAQTGEPMPAAQVLVYPLTTGEQYGDSMLDAADARPLNRPLLSWMAMHAFAGKPAAARDPRVDLLSLSGQQLAGMPPTMLITDERDPLRSQGEEFARHLDAAGVPTTMLRYDGVMHEFFGAAAVLDKAADAQQKAAEHIMRQFPIPAAAPRSA
ncbi:alpha/beta hydrolase fold domain-containing protein [Micromonospora tarensis]|uniref:Alpha/beta hydrolase fold domain-containing protein n=1 Tax=Micromonospora tarensis TaxID=2806100 RepID=A0ABS1YIN6_9ACTN|nr:alpha/beta hydrolase fold domain-containing protein [Micromonospora tarensis]MBM0277168.1 alpha/beta hydrolase fold domain-containing protein [Micromonospora tarensis]